MGCCHVPRQAHSTDDLNHTPEATEVSLIPGRGLSDSDTVAERAFGNIAGYGPLQPLLDDDSVWEIMINA